MSDVNLGATPDTNATRDAIHIAIAPIIARVSMQPGTHCGIDNEGMASPHSKPHIGIVDPFLKEAVATGGRFWLCLYQKTVTGMRHEWQHPSFQDSVPVTQPCASPSEKWLREFAESVDADYDKMMRVAATHCDEKDSWGGDYLSEGGKWEGQGTPEEFWTHFAAVTGKKGSGGIFSCSC